MKLLIKRKRKIPKFRISTSTIKKPGYKVRLFLCLMQVSENHRTYFLRIRPFKKARLTQKNNKMKRQLSHLVLLLLLLAGCGSSDQEVKLESTNFQQEISLQQNLEFTFSEFLVPLEKLGIWLDVPYITFEPAIKGQFKWVERNKLIFSPDEGFEPSTDYIAKLNSQIVQDAAERRTINRSKTLAFHTPYLSLQSREVFWAMGKAQTPEVRLSLRFNYPVNPDLLSPLLNIQIDNNKSAYQILTNTVSQVIELVIAQKTESLDQKMLEVTLQEGISGKNKKSEQNITFKVVIPEKDRFKINQITTDIENDQYIVRVNTNQALGDGEVDSYVKIIPDIDFEIEKMNHGFLIKADFSPQTNYQVNIKKGLKGIFGGKIQDAFSQTILFGEIDPMIAFADNDAIYLTSKGNKQIDVRIMATPEVHITVHKIFKNNLIHYLRDNNLLTSSDYEEDEYYYYYNNTDISDYGELVIDKNIKTKDLATDRGLKILPLLELENKQDLEGIYIVKLYSTEQRYVNDQTIVSISDIGLIAKASSNQIMVATNSIATTEPISGLEVILYSHHNQEILTKKTDDDGIIYFEDLKKKHPSFKVDMIMASNGQDFNYLHFKQTPVNTSEFEIGGMIDNATGSMAFIYGDRDLYRPGDTVHIKSIVRDRNWQPLTGVPYLLRVLLPNGKVFLSRKGVLSDQGSLETNLKLPDAAVTGSYAIQVFSGNEVLLGSKAINVEEFMPDRIKVLPTISKSVILPGDLVTVGGTVYNMFGPPAAKRKTEIEMVVKREQVNFKKYPDYQFYLNSEQDNSFFKSELKKSRTSPEGKFSNNFIIPSSWKDQGLLNANFYITAFDETGRPVSRLEKAKITTQPAMLGIGNLTRYVKVTQSLRIPLIAVNHEGQLLNKVNARVEVYRRIWQSAYTRDDRGRFRYVSKVQERLEKAENITINGDSQNFYFVPEESGSYVVKLRLPNSETFVSQYFYAYSWGSSSISSYQINKDGKIDISLDKEIYQVGDQAKVLFKVPFHGKLLITLERDKVIKHFTMDTREDAVVQELDIDASLLPNAFITATLIKPIGDNAIPLTVAHGFEPIYVEESSRNINLTIEAPEKSRSNRTQSVTVKSDLEEAGIEMTIAVVDEGILQIKNYQTPDPYGFFYQKRGLEVSSYDLYPRLYPEYEAAPSSFGSGGYDLGKRLNPLANKRVKLLAIWSGTRKTNSRGEVKFDFDLPAFSGEVRVMAVAAKDEAFGSADLAIKVANPMVVSAGLPRFMSPSDQVTMPVTVTNTTNQAASAQVSVGVSGAVSTLGSTSQSISVPANSEKQVIFKLLAEKTIGQAQVVAKVDALGESFSQTTDLTVRPPTSLLKASGSGQVQAGRTELLDLKHDFLQSSVEGKLLISRSPTVGLAKSMKYLVGYPHGCLEQTISKAMPQIYLADLLEQMDEQLYGDPRYNVQAAIGKLSTMQLYNGSLSYWQGGNRGHWWSTTYAAHFLIEAQRAGYQVDQGFLDRILAYLRQASRNASLTEYRYYDAEGILKTTQIVPKSVFYSLYLLAMAGQPDRSTMNYYKSRLQKTAVDSRYLLAAAYLIDGDADTYRKILPSGFEDEQSEQATGGSFHSYIRDQGIALNALVEHDPKNPQIPRLARNLSEQIRQRHYLSTQEHAFALMALGKLARQNKGNQAKGIIRVDGQQVATFDGNNLTLTSEVAGKKVAIEAEGEGALYYFWDIEGLNEKGEFEEVDNFISIRRSFFTRDGQPLGSSPTVDQNELVVVRLTLRSQGASVENVVITDMLPGGFEVENPRISQVPGMDWITDKTNPEHLDIRDDRVHFYADASTDTQNFYYVVRAVTRGTYIMGSVSADAMYRGEYHSYHGAGTAQVR